MATSNNNKKGIKIFNIILLLIIGFCTYKIVSIKSVGVNVEKKIMSVYNTLKERDRLNTVSYDEYIELDGEDIDESLIDVVKLNLSLLPEKLTHAFFELNYGKIVITNKDIQSTYYKGEVEGNITGLYDGNNKILYLQSDKYAINYSLLHEFGHVLDDLTGWSTANNEKFKDIYLSDKDILITDDLDGHYLSNEREFFAQAFMEYILDKETLKNNTPITYVYVDNVLINLNAEHHDSC